MLKRKGRCIRTIFDKIQLCAGTMTDYLQVLNNTLQEATISQIQAQPSKALLYELFGRLEGVRPLARYDGIKMTPNTPEGNSSHVVYLPFIQEVFELDINKLYIKLEKQTRSRLFKMNKIENLGEQDQFLAVWCNETGFDDLEAAQT